MSTWQSKSVFLKNAEFINSKLVFFAESWTRRYAASCAIFFAISELFANKNEKFDFPKRTELTNRVICNYFKYCDVVDKIKCVLLLAFCYFYENWSITELTAGNNWALIIARDWSSIENLRVGTKNSGFCSSHYSIFARLKKNWKNCFIDLENEISWHDSSNCSGWSQNKNKIILFVSKSLFLSFFIV